MSRNLIAELMALQSSHPEWRELPIIKEQLEQASVFKQVIEGELNERQRDFKADLEEWHSDLIHGTRSTDWFYLVDNYIERALKAEEELARLGKRFPVTIDKKTQVIVDRKAFDACMGDNAALREENDLQRHSIQQLSAQVAGLREGLTNIAEAKEIRVQQPFGAVICTPSMESLQRYAWDILHQPDPGAEIMERMKKLEAVAEAARDYREHEYLASTDKWHEVIDRLDKSLDALAAVTPCP